MAVVKLSPDTQLDPPIVTKLPSDTKLDAPAGAEKTYLNDAGQPFTLSGATVPQPKTPDQGYTGTILPLRRDESGLHLAVPEAIASPVRGAATGGQRALGVGEAGQNPLRPLSPDQLAAVSVFADTPTGGMRTRLSEAKPNEKFIADQYTRAVKPTVSGKQTAGQLDRYQERARDAISSIVENKQNLKFTDADGNVRQGELPKSLEEFGDAIEQTKQKIFDRYDALARQSTNTGFSVADPATGQSFSAWASVPLKGIVSELQKIATDPVTGLMHPELVKYAQGRAAVFAQTGALSASDAQRAVASLNQTLKAFYRNPTYETAARANIDAMIANQLRSALDDTIKATAGPGYQELKNQYGALKEIEGDVNKRAQIVARQEKGGGILGRIADVGSAEEVIRGLVTLNPAAVVRGAALKGWAEMMKYMRSPNRAVTRLFAEADKGGTPKISASPVPGVAAQKSGFDVRESSGGKIGTWQDPMLGLIPQAVPGL